MSDEWKAGVAAFVAGKPEDRYQSSQWRRGWRFAEMYAHVAETVKERESRYSD